MSVVSIYCPSCRSEYREGFVTCSDCNVALVRRLASEVADALVPLAREGSFEFVAELLDRLEKQDVPYVIQAGTALRLIEDAGADVRGPEPWEARVWVTSGVERVTREIFDDLVEEWRLERGEQIARRYLDA